MKAKHQRLLVSIFARPTRANIEWKEAQRLIVALGGDVEQREGSRIRVFLNEVALNLHSPHPQKEMKKYAVELLRDFLEKAGVKP